MYQHRLAPLLALLASAGLAPAMAHAQLTPGNVELQQYQPPPFYFRYLRVDAPEVLPAWKLHFALDTNYAWRPLVVTDASPAIQAQRKTTYDLVRHAIGADLAVSLGIAGRVEVGGSLPFTVYQVGETTPGTKGPGLLGAGNPKLGIKARLYGGHHKPFGLGASLLVSIPTGIGGALIRETKLGGEARLFARYERERFSLAGSGGYRLRGAGKLFDVPIGNELTFGAAGELRLLQHTRALAEVAGSTSAEKPFGATEETPVEALFGLRQGLGHLEITAAAGPGLRAGYGSPALRGVLSLAWSDAPHDADGDGIPDDADRCPNDPEDKDGFEDKDGCPDPDNDKDKIPDGKDKCPNDPEDKDGFEDDDGCPDPDNDKDKIPDASDKCSDKPETYNDFEDEDGCPDEVPPAADRDKDGINDDVDECPDEPEDKDGFEDEDGCPDPDNDKDGIPDAKDKCPNEPETINGKDDEDGCPDKGEAAVKIGAAELETLRPIFFDTDRARVRHAFYNILGQVALTLKAHPEIGRCAVEGHTDDTGPVEWNLKLSQLRAQSVVEFLVKKGVARDRLTAIGHGEKTPWTSNDTPWGRAKNRRVLFHVEGVNLEDQQKQERRKSVRAHAAAKKARAAEQDEEKTPAATPEEKSPAPRPAREKAPPATPPREAPARETPAHEKPGAESPPAPAPASSPKPAKKTKSAEPEDPTSLRDLLKLPAGNGDAAPPPPPEGPRNLPKRRLTR